MESDEIFCKTEKKVNEWKKSIFHYLLNFGKVHTKFGKV